MKGTILAVWKDLKYGYIRGQDGQRYFFHRTEVRDGTPWGDLQAGQAVRFIALQGERKRKAVRVRRLLARS